MDEQREQSEDLSELAYCLLRDQAGILAQWHERVDAQPEVSALKDLSRAEFADHIPDFLDRISGVLRGEDSGATQELAIKHGAHRWRHGASLKEIADEWRLLHDVLMDYLANAADAAPAISVRASREAYRVLADEIHRGVAYSVMEYEARQRVEAEARMRDLETIFEKRDEREKLRGQNLREISHDLRGSLHGLQLACYLLKAQPLAEQAAVIAERIDYASQNLDRLLRDLLDLARLEAGREELGVDEFDAASLLRDLCKASQPLAESKGLALRARGAASLPVCGDAIKVRRIAQNLILNALKYTSAGRVDIGWELRSPQQWMFYVRDTGPGLSTSTAGPLAHELEEAGDDDERAPEEPESPPPVESGSGATPVAAHGEGIGLAIVRQLCELLDAILEVESESGKGATFRVLLPTAYPPRS